MIMGLNFQCFCHTIFNNLLELYASITVQKKKKKSTLSRHAARSSSRPNKLHVWTPSNYFGNPRNAVLPPPTCHKYVILVEFAVNSSCESLGNFLHHDSLMFRQSHKTPDTQTHDRVVRGGLRFLFGFDVIDSDRGNNIVSCFLGVSFVAIRTKCLFLRSARSCHFRCIGSERKIGLFDFFRSEVYKQNLHHLTEDFRTERASGDFTIRNRAFIYDFFQFIHILNRRFDSGAFSN